MRMAFLLMFLASGVLAAQTAAPAAQAPMPAAQTPAAAPTGAATAGAAPQNTEANPAATISVRSTLVMVPALVKTKSGQLVFTLKASDFTVKDDGVPQKIRVDDDTGRQPLALVVVVEVGGDGIAYLPAYHDLGPLLDAIVGNVPHRIAIVDFDSEPELLHGFTSSTDKIVTELNRIESGDNGAAVLDAMSFATKLLRSCWRPAGRVRSWCAWMRRRLRMRFG